MSSLWKKSQLSWNASFMEYHYQKLDGKLLSKIFTIAYVYDTVSGFQKYI